MSTYLTCLIKKTSLIVLVNALVGLGMVGSQVMAGTATGSLAVSAQINNSCIVTNGSLNFGIYDPVVANASSPDDADGTFQVTCTDLTNYTIALDDGLYAGLGSAGARAVKGVSSVSYLGYDIYQDAGRTTLWNSTSTESAIASGTPQTFTAHGRAPGGQSGVQADSYADTVGITVTF